MPWNESRWKIVGGTKGDGGCIDLKSGIFHGIWMGSTDTSTTIWSLGSKIWYPNPLIHQRCPMIGWPLVGYILQTIFTQPRLIVSDEMGVEHVLQKSMCSCHLSLNPISFFLELKHRFRNLVNFISFGSYCIVQNTQNDCTGKYKELQVRFSASVRNLTRRIQFPLFADIWCRHILYIYIWYNTGFSGSQSRMMCCLKSE